MSTQELRLDPARTALLVVDMQNDFCHDKGFFPNARERLAALGLDPTLIPMVIPRIKDLLAAARETGAYVVHTRMVRDPNMRWVESVHRIVPSTFSVYRGVTKLPLMANSWGVDTIDELKPAPGEYVVQKRVYSAFYQTDLEMMLRRRGIQTVVIAGTITYACVLHTVFDAFCRDFDVIVPEDAVSSLAADLQQPALRIVDLLLGAVMPTSKVVAALRAAP